MSMQSCVRLVRAEHGSKIIPFSTGTLQQDTLIVGTVDGTVYALDAHTGKERWSFRSGSRLYASSHAPIIPGIDGSLYLFTTNGLKVKCFPVSDDNVVDTDCTVIAHW